MKLRLFLIFPDLTAFAPTRIGAGEQDVLRWFILVVATLLDPAAVLLLLAATRR